MRLWMTRLPGQIANMAEVCDLCFDRGVSNTSQSPIKIRSRKGLIVEL